MAMGAMGFFLDWFEPYPTGAAIDPQGPIKGTERVLRVVVGSTTRRIAGRRAV